MMNFQTWGSGEKKAVLLHGLSSDSNSWQFVGPRIAEAGYTVIAPDLIGHGLSEWRSQYDLAMFVGSLVEDMPSKPDLVIGHSLGGLLAASALPELMPGKIIYVEPAWGAGNDSVDAIFRARKFMSFEQVQQTMPNASYSVQQTRYNALKYWDLRTLQIIAGFPGYTPGRAVIPSLVILAGSSMVVSPQKAGLLSGLNFTVRQVSPGGHVIHNDNLEGFMDSIKDWL